MDFLAFYNAAFIKIGGVAAKLGLYDPICRGGQWPPVYFAAVLL
jgi:hypothetical protein